MTVEELIQKLGSIDPKRQVKVNHNNYPWRDTSRIESVDVESNPVIITTDIHEEGYWDDDD